jgi:heme exporter protein C
MQHTVMKIISYVLKSVYVLMPITIVMAFLWVPPAEILGDYSRIIYFHVPLAWVSILAFIVSGMLSIVYLFDKKHTFRLLDGKSYNSAAVGLAFTILTVITGSIWAKLSWGTFWNWDPRESSIVFVLLIYVAYFSLYAALSGNSSRGKIGSVYLILAMTTLPFFMFLAPRVMLSLHPDTIININRTIYMDDRMWVTLLIALVSFTILYGYILNLMDRMMFTEKKIEDLRHGDD